MALRLRRFPTAALVALLVSVAPLGARADDGDAEALRTTLVQPATDALRAVLQQPVTTAQARPIGEQERPLSRPGLPTGLTWTLDASVAKALGNTGFSNGLPGGMDAVAGYGFNRNLRLQAGYYDFQEYPIGFDNGTVPVYVQGLAAPIGTQNLAASPADVAVENHIIVAGLQNLVTIGGRLPIVITPTYIARSGSVGFHSDAQLIEINGFPQTVRLRTVEYELIAFTFPFLSTPRMFGTFTLAPQWNVNLNGANITNHPQLFQLGYLEYRATNRATVFFQPSRLVNYLPPDPYPEHVITFIYGASYKFVKNAFAQVVFSTGTPSNDSTLGIQSLTLQQIPSPTNPVPTYAPSIAGLKATQVQLEFGIGTPSVIPL